jgi:hypothetical protein
MLYFLNLWLFLLPCCGLLGAYALLRLERSSDVPFRDRAIASLWLGLLAWSVVFLALSLYRPLSLGLGVGVMGLGSGLCLLDGKLRRQVQWGFANLERGSVLGSAIVMVGLAAWIAQTVTWHDTGYYHYSAIEWFRDFGSVPGIALLFKNLGFTSSWFALAAPFNPAFAAARVTAGLNGLALLIAMAHWGLAAHAWRRGVANLSDRLAVMFYTLAIPICLVMKPLSLILISPSPDVPVLLLVGAVAWAMAWEGNVPNQSVAAMVGRPLNPPILGDFETDLARKSPRIGGLGGGSAADIVPMGLVNKPRLLPVALAAGAVGLKLTALPLLMFSALYYLIRSGFGGIGRRLVGVGAIALLFLTPLMASSVVTSGCPLYPSAVMCLDLPWSPSAQSVKDVAAGTHGWTTWYGTPPQGMPAWIWAMERWLTTDRSELITGLLILGAILWVGIQLLRQTKRRQKLADGQNRWSQTPVELWIAGLGIFGIAFLMVTTPFFRFSVAYIVLLLAVGASNLNLPIARLANQFNLRRWGMPGAIALVIPVVLLSLQRQHFANLVMPPPMRSTQVIERQTNGITYFAPASGDIPNTQAKDMCWSAPVPCTYDIAKDVYLRDPNLGLAGGFVRDRPTQSR